MKQLDGFSFTFGALMNITVKLDTQLDKALKPFDLTAKQWYLLMILDSLFEAPPTLKQASKQTGSSYQNIKQMALKLQSKGLLHIEKDPSDFRALRLVMTDKAKQLSQKLAPTAETFLAKFYDNVPSADIQVVARVMFQMINNLNDMEQVDWLEQGL